MWGAARPRRQKPSFCIRRVPVFSCNPLPCLVFWPKSGLKRSVFENVSLINSLLWFCLYKIQERLYFYTMTQNRPPSGGKAKKTSVKTAASFAFLFLSATVSPSFAQLDFSEKLAKAPK